MYMENNSENTFEIIKLYMDAGQGCLIFNSLLTVDFAMTILFWLTVFLSLKEKLIGMSLIFIVSGCFNSL